MQRSRTSSSSPEIFPGCRLTRLEQNYRSTQPVLDLANGVLAAARRSYGKKLFTTHKDGHKPARVEVEDAGEQSEHVVGRVLALREQGVPLQQIAVLFRSAQHAADLEVSLNRANIPFRKFGGLRFTETAHVKDVVAVLRIVANPRDELAWFRVLQWLDGVGKVTAERLTRAALERDPPALDPELGEGKRYAADLALLASTLAAASGSNELGTVVGHATDLVTAWLPRLYDDAPRRARDLDALHLIAQRADSLEDLLADLALDPPDSAEAEPADQEDEWLTLSTVHSAKGLEWDAVFVLHVADGAFPSSFSLHDADAVEEERRLLYVAVTRARRSLELLQPVFVRSAGRQAFAPGCSLLDDVPNLDILTVAQGPAVADPVEATPAPSAQAHLARILDFFGEDD